ncbi:MAG TPA: DsbA family protein [Solirubrobacteraceae bacterium]|jgi:2-hydroxychromene-2-carboxylate isomerase
MSSPTASFYFDLASPLAYLAAERVLHTLPGPAEWQPVLARELGAPVVPEPRGVVADASQTDIFARAYARARGKAVFESTHHTREEIARRAREQGLQSLRWPDPFPFDSALAMRVATYAKSIGRTVPFAQAAFRQAFAGGHDLERIDFVLIAAAACEMHPRAVRQGEALRSVREELSRATAAAAAAGVSDVPAVRVGEGVWVGERAVEDAAAHMSAAMTGPSR